MKKCAIYTRVSTDMQAEKEYNSCQSQETKIRAFIESQDKWDVYQVYSDEGYSGATLQRPGFQKMLSDIENIDIILFYKMDRLTRSPKDFYQLVELFEKHEVDFISITERFDTSTPAGRLLRNIMLTFGQFERELTSERVKDKMFERAKLGFWNGGFIPYGYNNVSKKLLINKEEAEVVKFVYETFIETESLFKTYRTVKKAGIRTRGGNVFDKSMLYKMLRNPIYTGRTRYGEKSYQGIHEAIISDDMFELARNYHKKRFLPNKPFRDYAFAGIVKCGECSSHMTPTYAYKDKKGVRKRYNYYRCTKTYHQDWYSCSVRQINSARLEKYVFENLERISNDMAYIDNLIFRLNHTLQPPYREGFEQTAENFPFSANFFRNRLKTILKENSVLEGVERNIFLRKEIQDIIYSKEKIVINFIDTDYSGDSRENFRGVSLQAGAEGDSPRSGEQTAGGDYFVSDSVNKNRFEKSLVAETFKLR
ncbi:MAG: recombinase family protein [Elusimicrobiota bacterium]